jgi:hypothetical protein
VPKLTDRKTESQLVNPYRANYSTESLPTLYTIRMNSNTHSLRFIEKTRQCNVDADVPVLVQGCGVHRVWLK